MKALIQSATTEGVDQKQLARSAALLRQFKGGEDIASALSGARGLTQDIKMLTGKGSRGGKGIQAAARMAGNLGMQLSTEQLAKLRKGGAGAEKLISSLATGDGTLGQRQKQLLQALQKGDKAELLDVGRASVAGTALAEQGRNVLISDRVRKTEAGDIVGRLGSKQGVHMELSRQTKILQDMLNHISKGKGGGVGQPNSDDAAASGKPSA
jgi:hypothetical protein